MLEILVLEASQEALVRHLEAVEAQVVPEQPLDLEVRVADEVKNYQFSVMLSKKAKKTPISIVPFDVDRNPLRTCLECEKFANKIFEMHQQTTNLNF